MDSRLVQGELVGNKAKGLISKRALQENKARQIFQKTNISYPLISSEYQVVTNDRLATTHKTSFISTIF